MQETLLKVVNNVCSSLFWVLIYYLFTLYDVKEEFSVNRRTWILKVLGCYAIIKLCNLGIVLLTYLALCFISYERLNLFLMIVNLVTNISISMYIQHLFVASFFINDGVPALP